MILGSGIGSVITPFAKAFAAVLAWYYSFTHNYGIAIICLTLTVMIVVFPLTRRGTRSMMRMQLLAPELQKIRERYKKDKGQTAQERQEAQKALNEEMMAMYRENSVSPTGGCLPTFMQFPIFIVLYDVIRGMTKVKTVVVHGRKVIESAPQYLSQSTLLYKNLIHSGGKMEAFGLNLADSVRTHQHSWLNVAPYVVVILIAVALQYVSIWQITNRNPAAAQANPQMQSVQKFMPLIFVFLYIVLPAGVGVYFIVSSAFRVAQQEYMYKHDKHIVEAVAQLRSRKPITTTATDASGKKGFFASIRELSGQGPSAPALNEGKPAAASGRSPTSTKRVGPAKPGPSKSSGASSSGASKPAAGGGTKPSAGGGSRPPGPATRPNQGKAPANARGTSGANGRAAGSNGRAAGSNTSNTARNDEAADPAPKPPPPRSQSKRPRRPR